MNYIELIKYFWLQDKTYSLNGCETRLYFYLVETANCLHWELTFWQRDMQIMGNVGISKNTLNSCRNRLKQAELIEFESGGKGYGNKTRYQILTPNSTPKVIPNSLPKSIPKVAPNDNLGTDVGVKNCLPKVTPLIKQRQKHIKISTVVDTKVFEPNADFETPPIPPSAPPKERKKVPPKKESQTDLNFVSPELLPIVEKWLRYRADVGKAYKSDESIHSMYKRLLKCSEGDAQKAEDVIDDAMANGWTGFGFNELKKQNNDNNGNSKPSSRKTIVSAQDADRESTI